MFDDDKKCYLYDKIIVSDQNFTTEHVKFNKIPRFFRFYFFKISQVISFLCLNYQIPGFFQVK